MLRQAPVDIERNGERAKRQHIRADCVPVGDVAVEFLVLLALGLVLLLTLCFDLCVGLVAVAGGKRVGAVTQGEYQGQSGKWRQASKPSSCPALP